VLYTLKLRDFAAGYATGDGKRRRRRQRFNQRKRRRWLAGRPIQLVISRFPPSSVLRRRLRRPTGRHRPGHGGVGPPTVGGPPD